MSQSVVLIPAKVPGFGDVALYLVVSRGPGPADFGSGFLYASGPANVARRFIRSGITHRRGDDLVMVEIRRMYMPAARVDEAKRRAVEPKADVWWFQG